MHYLTCYVHLPTTLYHQYYIQHIYMQNTYTCISRSKSNGRIFVRSAHWRCALAILVTRSAHTVAQCTTYQWPLGAIGGFNRILNSHRCVSRCFLTRLSTGFSARCAMCVAPMADRLPRGKLELYRNSNRELIGNIFNDISSSGNFFFFLPIPRESEIFVYFAKLIFFSSLACEGWLRLTSTTS